MNLICKAVCEVYIDGRKDLKRDTTNGVAFANFAAHKFRYLNLPPLVSASVKDLGDCGKLCVDHSSCFSTNLAAVRDQDGNISCELLSSDKYNNSAKFINSAVFHHLNIKVSTNLFIVTPLLSHKERGPATRYAFFNFNDVHQNFFPRLVSYLCRHKS